MNLAQRWRYPISSARRDLRLDLLRGYCIVVMTIDHVGLFPAWTIGLTGNARLWVSAAEGFFLIAGIVMGMVYQQWLIERGWQWSIKHAGRRAIQLYAIGAIGHLVLATGDFVLRLVRSRPSNLPTDYFQLVQGAIFQTRPAPEALSLMPLYALLIVWGLAALYGLRQGKWRRVLLGSFALWYVARLEPTAFVIFRTDFNFATWQCLFIIGLVAGYHRDELRRKWLSWPARHLLAAALIVSTGLMLLLSYQVGVGGLWSDVAWLQPYGPVFDRNWLGPGRIVTALWAFAGYYALVTAGWRPLQRTLGWLLMPLGQHALTAFILQAIAVYLIVRLPGWPFADHDPTLMGFVHVAIILAIWLATWSIARCRAAWSLRRLTQSGVAAFAEQSEISALPQQR